MLIKEMSTLYLHVPKAAGQSVEQAFLAELGIRMEDRRQHPNLLMFPNSDPKAGPPNMAHLSYREMLARGDIEAGEMQHVFAVVRNPYTRLFSVYRFWKHFRRMSFRDFVLKNFPQPGDDDYRKFTSRYRHVMPQVELLKSPDGTLATTDIIPFENLKAGFPQLAKKVGLSQLELPHRNKTDDRYGRLTSLFRRPHPDHSLKFSDVYDSETIDFVKSYYSEDFDLLGYDADFAAAKNVPLSA